MHACLSSLTAYKQWLVIMILVKGYTILLELLYNWWEQSSRRHSVPTSMLKNKETVIFLCFKSTEIWLLLKKYALMTVCNWVVCNGACRCTATVWAIFLAPRHRVWSLRLYWWSGVQRVPGDRSGCRDWEIGARDAGPGGGWGRHAPLDWNSYCVHELPHNTLLFLFVFGFY